MQDEHAVESPAVVHSLSSKAKRHPVNVDVRWKGLSSDIEPDPKSWYLLKPLAVNNLLTKLQSPAL